MKPLSYYETTSVSIPKKNDYMTIYYYKKGVMVGMKRQFDDDFQAPNGCVEEYVLDEVSYNAHLKHYQAENKRLQDEFRKDLIEKYEITGHPKADKIFNKAWDMGCSLGYQTIQDYFEDFIELFKDDLEIGRNECIYPSTYSYDTISFRNSSYGDNG
jgi:hypothetical protein